MRERCIAADARGRGAGADAIDAVTRRWLVANDDGDGLSARPVLASADAIARVIVVAIDSVGNRRVRHSSRAGIASVNCARIAVIE